MRFDDRLATLLTLPVAGAHDRAVRWRQLVELAARAGRDDEGGAPFIAAVAVIRADATRVARDVRSAAARSIAGQAIALPLMEIFAADELAVAAPLFAARKLTQAQFDRLVEIADPEVRAFIMTLNAGLAGKEGHDLTSIVSRLHPAPTDVEPSIEAEDDLSDVEPQENDRHEPERSEWPLDRSPEAGEAFAAVAARESGQFAWESNASGDIAWVEGVPRGALIGMSLADGDDVASISELFASREAFEQVGVEMAALGGEYLFSGVPAFDPDNGRFLGYRGTARLAPSDAEVHDLPRPPKNERTRPAATTRSVESLRELVHEIKTPLNAIIGFAEIIDGQFLGPAHRGYRERAAGIVAQARVLLGAIEDLDFAARVQADREKGQTPKEADVASIAKGVVDAMRAVAARKDVRIVADFGDGAHYCRLDKGIAERLLRRLFGAILEVLESGETLFVEGKQKGSHCQLEIARPHALQGLAPARLFDPALSVDQEGPALLGLGFSLRLVRGLVRIAGGELTIEPDRFVVHLPSSRP